MRHILAALTVGLVVSVASTEPNRNVTFVSDAMVSGYYRDVKIVGDRIYCAVGYGVVVWTFDENSPNEPPVEIGRFPTPGQAYAIFIDDTLCYVADGSRGLRIYDVSDLNNVEELGVYEETTGFIGVTVGEGVAYLARSRIGIYTVNVSDPTNPSLLGSIQFYTENGRLVLHNGYLWASLSNRGYWLTAFDVSDPRNIRIAGQYQNAGAGGGFSFNGDVAFISRDSLTVLDISNPLEIGYLTSYRNAQYGYGIVYKDGYLYGRGGQVITDVRNLNNIRTIGFVAPNGLLTGMGMPDFLEDYVYVPASQRGLKIVNVRDKTRPFIQHVNLTNGDVKDVIFRNGYIYVADAQTGAWPVPREGNYYRVGRMRVYRVTDPQRPVLVADVDGLLDYQDDGFTRIDLFRDTLVCLNGPGTTLLNILDISDPEHPELILGGGPNDPRIGAGRSPTYEGELMFVAGDAPIMGIESLRNPERPERLLTYMSQENNRFYKIFAVDNFLLVSGQVFGQYNAVFTYDWSDLENVRRVGEWGQINGLKADGVRNGDYLYLVGGGIGSGLSVVDISDPLHPHEVHHTNEVRIGYRPRVVQNHLFVPDGTSGVRIFDLEDPSLPQQVGYYDTPGGAGGVAVDEDRGFLFVADGSNLTIYDIGLLLRAWDLAVMEEVHDFGDVALDSTAVWPLTLINRSEREVVIDSVRLAGDGFTVDDVDGFAIAPDEELEVWVFFAPDSSQEYNGEAVVYSMGRRLKVQLSGRGAPLSAPQDQTLPTEFALHPPFPNPFNGVVTIRYDLPEASPVRIAVYDLSGREVARLAQRRQPAGRHSVVWEGANTASGIYTIQLEASGQKIIRKVLLLK